MVVLGKSMLGAMVSLTGASRSFSNHKTVLAWNSIKCFNTVSQSNNLCKIYSPRYLSSVNNGDAINHSANRPREDLIVGKVNNGDAINHSANRPREDLIVGKVHNGDVNHSAKRPREDLIVEETRERRVFEVDLIGALTNAFNKKMNEFLRRQEKKVALELKKEIKSLQDDLDDMKSIDDISFPKDKLEAVRSESFGKEVGSFSDGEPSEIEEKAIPRKWYTRWFSSYSETEGFESSTFTYKRSKTVTRSTTIFCGEEKPSSKKPRRGR